MDQLPGQTQPSLDKSSFPGDKTSEKEISLLLGIESLTITNPLRVSELRSNTPLSEPEKSSNPPVQAHAKCQYCGDSFSQDLINQHQEDCDMRKIFCEGCGTLIPIEVFDYHTNMCVYQADVADPEGEHNEEDWQEEGYDEHYDDEEGMDENYGYNAGLHTYEQLSALDNTIVKKGISEEDMKNFPIEEYKAEEGEVRCSVCLTEYESGESLRKLSCGHKFHKDCVDTWLAHNITCPVCKKYFR